MVCAQPLARCRPFGTTPFGFVSGGQKRVCTSPASATTPFPTDGSAFQQPNATLFVRAAPLRRRHKFYRCRRNPNRLAVRFVLNQMEMFQPISRARRSAALPKCGKTAPFFWSGDAASPPQIFFFLAPVDIRSPQKPFHCLSALPIGLQPQTMRGCNRSFTGERWASPC
jgi:hypothetical protein